MRIERLEPQIVVYNVKPETENDLININGCSWARFSFDKANGRITINSDAGDYTYEWGHNDHQDFLYLMSTINQCYLLEKISSQTYFDVKTSKTRTIENLKKYGLKYYGIKTEKELKSVIAAIKDISDNSTDREFFESVQQIVPSLDWDMVEIVKDYPATAYTIADIFIKYVQPQIKEDFVKKVNKDATEIITKEMICKGLCDGTVQIINNPNDGCIAAQIGEYWFYFAGREEEELKAKEYLKSYTNDEIADMIFDVINSEPIKGTTDKDSSEWLYYLSVLTESRVK